MTMNRANGHPHWGKVAAIAVVVVTVMLLLTARHDRPDLNLDRNGFGLPIPPADAHYSGGNTLIAIIWLSIVGLVGFGLAIRDYLRTKQTMALFVTISAPMI